ncbi:acyl-CoA N-acyltransferase [Xylaria sp. CBS 124048]|nr:acyl-CoA N-acyltransferase [Xylaria sp. CBS 124048]
MPLELHPATEADAERAAAIEKEAYASDLFMPILFPGPFPEPQAGQKDWRVEELQGVIREDPSVRWLKVIDTDIKPDEANSQMIGFAQWNINDGSQPPPKPRTFGVGANVAACKEASALLQTTRRSRQQTKHVHLSMLHVDPRHQRRGAGRMLVMWGVEEAKKLGFPVFLESSEVGASLYLTCGFSFVDIDALDFTKWGKPATRITYIMALEH